MAVNVLHSLRALVDANGVPYSGALLTIYAAGTTTKLAVYSDSTLTTPAANPIVCSAGGVCPIRYIGTASYKITATKADGTTLDDYSGDNIDPGIATVSGVLPIANGGTAGATAGAARTNLSAAAQSDMTTAQTDISNLQTWSGYNLTTGSRMASGTTAQQPAAATVGKFRWNTTTGIPEIDNGAAWKGIGMEGSIARSYLAASFGLVCIQRSRTVKTTAQTLTTVMPVDGTIPTSSEGDEITDLAVNFTPLSTSSVIRIKYVIEYGMSNANSNAGLALYLNAGTSATRTALGIGLADTYVTNKIILEYEYSPASVSTIQTNVRAGPTTGATMYVNSSGDTDTMGGTRESTLTIEEWLTI